MTIGHFFIRTRPLKNHIKRPLLQTKHNMSWFSSLSSATQKQPVEYPPCITICYEKGGNIYHILTFLPNKQVFRLTQYDPEATPVVEKRCVTWKNSSTETMNLLAEYVHGVCVTHSRFSPDRPVYISTNFGIGEREVAFQNITATLMETLLYMKQVVVDTSLF